MEFHLILVDPKPALCAAWQAYFADLPRVEIVNGTFEQVREYDCIVSPGNAFGLMDGGMDAAIIKRFGQHLMNRVQNFILSEYLGEQPVGTSFIMDTGDEQHPWLAHTPTMRVPMEIAHTDNVYLATWALLRTVHHYNRGHVRRIERILCPGMGTGTGRVPFREAARQMAAAYRHYLNPPTAIDWQYANARQQTVRYGGDSGFGLPPEV